MLALLAALIVALFLAITGGNVTNPGKNFKVHLGLDLTSGTEVALKAVQPNGSPPKQSQMAQAIQIMDSRVNGAGFTEAQVQQQGSDIINVSVPGRNAKQVVGLVSQTAKLLFRQVLLQAPNTASAAPAPSATPTPAPSGSASPKGPASHSPSASPKASASGSAAGLPGSARTGGAKELAHGARRAHASAARPAATRSPSPSPSASGSATGPATPAPTPPPSSGTSTWQQASGIASAVSAPVKALFNKLNCADPRWKERIGYTHDQWDIPANQIVSCGSLGGVTYKFALDKAKVLGSDIRSASASLEPNTTFWQVILNFNSHGTKAFGDLTTALFARYHGSQVPQNEVAVVLDGQAISFPTINSAIVGGSAQITGNFDQRSATNLANVLSYGALPLSFQQQQVQSVSPQLGRDQLDAGLIAAGFGLILVVVYLLFYYRGLAIIATSSLIIAAVLAYESVVALGKFQGFALNLAGIAGLIVAIGITADSFVVFFERLRDEVREGGRSLRAAVERGWVRARRTILVSDTVSFLAAALLYYFAIGEVRGFAFTLGLTTIIDVIVVFTFTHPMMTLLARTKFFGGGHKLSGLDPERLGARAPWRSSVRTPRPARPSPARASSRPAPPKEA